MAALKINPMPLWYRFLMSLPYGRWRALHYLKDKGKLNQIVHHKFHNRTLVAPLSELLPVDLTSQMKRRVVTFVGFCSDNMDRFDFLDCGAHMGTFSAQFTTYSAQVEKLIIVEPNPDFFPIIQFNSAKDRAQEIECVNAAISDFEGRGRLVKPEGLGTPAMYLVNDPDGDIPVTTLAAIIGKCRSQNVAIKLDIEGCELLALRSATDELRSLSNVLLFVEVHKESLRRAGMTDQEMVTAINEIRPFSWYDATDGRPVDVRKPILEQLGFDRECDLIGVSA